MRLIKTGIAACIALGTGACSHKVTTPQKFEGLYSGEFRYYNPQSNASAQSAPITVSFSGYIYDATGAPDKKPAGGSGTFSMEGNKVKFEEKSMWTADFDWNMILKGTYDYQVKADSLILTKTAEQGDNKYPTIYRYALKKN
ncbi:hypothetical protein [Hufsiella ginkgonis]|uniref:Lipocalin-like domain-containing protein n=1 Tax=Hufsiella ginkgonis TaxID=2695274 RepID=A0A7K1XX50_9SPHI|nr:hypothetical protein [Hufsiella ginkgonis]MXV15584.1 hypothetical protein [Hufsiella ginkgonis]